MKSVTTLFGCITPAQIATLHTMTRNTRDRRVSLPIELVTEVEGIRGELEDVPRKNFIVLRSEDGSLEFKIDADGRIERET